jgi:hypothetical protein
MTSQGGKAVAYTVHIHCNRRQSSDTCGRIKGGHLECHRHTTGNRYPTQLRDGAVWNKSSMVRDIFWCYYVVARRSGAAGRDLRRVVVRAVECRMGEKLVMSGSHKVGEPARFLCVAQLKRLRRTLVVRVHPMVRLTVSESLICWDGPAWGYST